MIGEIDENLLAKVRNAGGDAYSDLSNVDHSYNRVDDERPTRDGGINNRPVVHKVIQ